MTISKTGFAVITVMAALALLLFQVNVSQADNSLKLQVLGPPAGVKVGTQFSLTIKAYNFQTSAVTFNRVVVGYVNPDLSVKGPLLVSSVSRTVPAGTRPNPWDPVTPGVLTFAVPFTIVPTEPPLPANTILPIMVTLWNNAYTAGNERGAGAGGVKIIVP
ncbi:MAG: hypothetical protein FJ126_08850 [Deltaproteobacteria bacterium]|nr:hypothetical protein [Deltaproteobacteria bacterium]